MRLAVVIPSRGLIHSRTIAAILRETHGHDAKLFFAHSRPIPECFNEPCAEALAWGADRVWFVEEDMHLPDGILAELWAALDSGHTVAAADYPAGGHPTVNRHDGGAVLWTGTGCLLAEARELADRPFTTDHHYELRRGLWVKMPGPSGYGGHDVNFGMALRAEGHPIHVIATRCGQYRITRTANAGTNDHGWHDISLITEHSPSQEDTP